LFRRWLGVWVDELLELVVHDEHKGTTRATDDVRASALEEGTAALVSQDLARAVEGRGVQDIGTASLHHHATTHGVEWVRDDTGDGGDELSHQPLLPHWSVLWVLEGNVTERIVATEESSTVHNDTADRHTEALVQALEAILLVDGGDAVAEASVHTRLALANISGKTGTSEVEWVHEEQRGGTGGTARSQVAEEEAPELVLLDTVQEELLVLVLEGEVQRLRWEVTDDVGQVATPERAHALVAGHTDEAVNDALVLVLRLDLGRSGLHLEEELDTLNWRDSGLGDTAGNTTGSQVQNERHGAALLFRGGKWLVTRNGAHLHRWLSILRGQLAGAEKNPE
ncbi:TPA: hypothetical protein N0F65_002278, partial [Lagenidium giganteum]